MACLYTSVAEARPGEPILPPVGPADELGALVLAYGGLAALLARHRYGISQEVHVSQLGAMTRAMGFLLNQHLFTGVETLRQKRPEAPNPLYSIYRCGDGRWIALGLVREKEWEPFCRAAGLDHRTDDPRFSSPAARAEHCRELIAILDKRFAERSRDEWAKLLRAADLMFSPVNTVAELASDPQAVENDYVTTFDHPRWGPIRMVGMPVHFSETPATLRRPAPEYGEHTLEVLTEVCGYSLEEVARLYELEVV